MKPTNHPVPRDFNGILKYPNPEQIIRSIAWSVQHKNKAQLDKLEVEIIRNVHNDTITKEQYNILLTMIESGRSLVF